MFSGLNRVSQKLDCTNGTNDRLVLPKIAMNRLAQWRFSLKHPTNGWFHLRLSHAIQSVASRRKSKWLRVLHRINSCVWFISIDNCKMGLNYRITTSKRIDIALGNPSQSERMWMAKATGIMAIGLNVSIDWNLFVNKKFVPINSVPP